MFLKDAPAAGLVSALVVIALSGSLAAASGDGRLNEGDRHLAIRTQENAYVYLDFVEWRIGVSNKQFYEQAESVTYDVYVPKDTYGDCTKLYVRASLSDFAQPAWDQAPVNSQATLTVVTSDERPLDGMCHFSGKQDAPIEVRSFQSNPTPPQNRETIYAQFLKISLSTNPKFYGQSFLHTGGVGNPLQSVFSAKLATLGPKPQLLAW